MDLSDQTAVEKLLTGCAKGNRKCQQKLYQTFYGKMFGVCMRYAADTSEAQDILQEGFIKIYSKLGSYQFKGSLEGWIRRIMVNNAIDHVRKKKEYHLIIGEDAGVSDIKDDYYEEKEVERYTHLKAEAILSLVQKLTPAYRTVFSLYVIENYTHQEIADTLKISVGASKSNLAKAKMKLREFFEQYKDEFERNT